METKIKHYVCPVCSGKSTMAQKLQNSDPEEILLIEANSSTDLNYVYTEYIQGCKFKKIIIDNFLKLYINKKNSVRKFINYIKGNNVEEIILFSTPDHLYDLEKDKKEMKKKFLDKNEVEIIQESYYHGITKKDRINLAAILPPNEFQSKVLGSLTHLII